MQCLTDINNYTTVRIICQEKIEKYMLKNKNAGLTKKDKADIIRHEQTMR